MPLEAGQTLSHYRLIEKIGEGGMGVVWKALDTLLEREIAIKTLPEELARDSERLGRFKREAKAVAALDHPNIVTVHSVEETEGVHFIIMELVRGRSLTELIPRKGLPPDKFFELAVALADAISTAHQQGITHRDLKPDNVMVGDDGRLKVLDFGLAKLREEARAVEAGTQLPTATMTQEGKILGTVSYMSPEQAQGKRVDPRSDVFSLGILLYVMATGKQPFRGDNNLSILTSIIRDTPQPISDSSPNLPPALDTIIGRCLNKEPQDRYDSAEELTKDLEKLRAATISGTSGVWGEDAVPRRPYRRTFWVAASLLLIAIIVVAAWWARHNARKRWARTEAIPRIQQLHQQSSWLLWGTAAWEAHDLATEAARYIGDDPTLQQLWSQVTYEITITSDPIGAGVYAKAYADVDGAWRYIGRTPMEKLRFPRGAARTKVDLAGHLAAYDLVLNVGYFGYDWHFALQRDDAIPEEMVFVPGGKHGLFLPGLDHLPPEQTSDFLVDRYEVTNLQYKRFLDAGGYENPAYWKHPFVENGRTLGFEEATARLRDTTGRPGPAGWEVMDYPKGEDSLPVCGVSWYEAAAYAEFAGKSLPTIFHWNQVALTPASGEIIPLSNFGGEGPIAADTEQAMHRYGAFNLAGNVREWCHNASTRGDGRFILGGGWNDQPYAFNDGYAQSAWDRSPTNGFRCIRYLKPEEATPELTRAIEMPFRDFYRETPVSDETFAMFLRQFEYDATPLNAQIVSEDEYEDWTQQRISFDAAYGDERVMAWLFVPKTPPPHQTVVFFPGSDAIHTNSSADIRGDGFSPLLKSGRAVMFPIYKSTCERGDELDSDYPNETNFYKEHVIMWAKDLARSIDYLESREDMDTGRLAFFGVSWGAVMGTILPAVEERIKINLLYVAGLLFQRALPEVDQINYVGRVRQPTLMVNGEFDFYFPVDTSQKPLYDLLGTPDDDKKYVVYPGSHSVPRVELVREVLAWLDEYQ